MARSTLVMSGRKKRATVQFSMMRIRRYHRGMGGMVQERITVRGGVARGE
jgi:hypothetical protein